MNLEEVEGDLVDQRDVDALVNAWNRNIIPRWLLVPQGVSRALRRAAGPAPFRELGYRPLPLGAARLTSAGTLPNRAIIHVAGINLLWRASEASICDSVRSAVALAVDQRFHSLAMPVIGAGSGGMTEQRALDHIRDTLRQLDADGAAPELTVRIVRYRPSR
jgi:O-acetyl-ADP-ribose deacetylase